MKKRKRSVPKNATASLLEQQYRARYELAQSPYGRREIFFEILDHCFDEAVGWSWFQQEFMQLFNASPDHVKKNWPAYREQQDIEFAANVDHRLVQEQARHQATEHNLSEANASLIKAYLREVEKKLPQESPAHPEPHAIPPLETLHKAQSLTQKNAAQALACTPRTVRSMIQKGELTLTPKKRVAVDSRFDAAFKNCHGSS